MSLARAVTKRMKRADAPKMSPPARSQSVKCPRVQIDRAKISGPVALVSTTNMLSYNAPDIASLKTKPSVSSTHSADDSDHSVTTRSRASSQASRETLTDASSVGSSPSSPKPNHLSTYFAAANPTVRKSISSGNLQQLREHAEEAVPAIPERALSHSKRAHEKLAQKRSLQNISRHNSTHSTRSSQRPSLEMLNATIAGESHPFGPELEQLNEVVEEFGGVVRDAAHEADLAIVREKHLASFCAADYLAELQPLFDARFGMGNNLNYPAPLAWI